MLRAAQVMLLGSLLLEAASAFATQRGTKSEPTSSPEASAAGALRRGRASVTEVPPAAPAHDGDNSWSLVSLGVALGLLVAVLGGHQHPANAEDAPREALSREVLVNGENVFLNNCAACHAGGNNAVQPEKKLKKEALIQFGMYDIDRIKYQVTNGKNAMPAFGERLGQQEINDVASYVVAQADKGW